MANTDESKYLQNIFSLTQTNAFRQIIFMVGVALSVAAGFYVYSTIQEPLYRPLDYRMTDKNSAAIADALDKANIQYKINNSDGVVMVAAQDAQQAKYKLAAAGIQRDDSLNFSYLSDQNSIGESQFIESARYLRALEGDLVKTITSIDGVSAAKVHIAIPTNNVFADESGKPTASIFITVGNGLIIDKEKVRSIVQIVASSVPGLDPKNVAITDQYGHYLSNDLSDDAIHSAEQMTYQNNVQNYYEKRIESLINPLIGANKVSVRVHANIDFSTMEEAKEKYDPDQKAVRSEETTTEEVGSSGASGPAGALANSPPTGGDAGAKGGSNSTQGRSSSIKNYELGKSVTYKKSNVANVSSISVAVVLDNDSAVDPTSKKEVSKPIDKERLAKITELVKATIGFNATRGDIVTVVNSSFNLPQIDAPPPPSHFWSEAWFWEIIKKVLSIGFALGVFITIYKKTSNHFATMKMPVSHHGASTTSESETDLSPEMRKLKQEQINQLKEIASKDPSRVALVMKNWVGDKQHG